MILLNSNIVKSVRHNVKNYGVYGFLYLLLYILLAIVLELVFHTSSLTGTLVSGVVMLILSVALFLKRAYKENVVSFQDYMHVKFKSKLFWYSYTVVVAYACLVFFNWFNTNYIDETFVARDEIMSDIPILILIPYSILIAPILEECMMRLFMYNQLKRSSHWIVSMIITSSLFALLHGTLSHIIFGTIFALALTIAYENTRCILIPIFGHLTYNFMSIFIPIDNYPTNNTYVLILFIFVIISLIISTIGLNYKLKSISYRDI